MPPTRLVNTCAVSSDDDKHFVPFGIIHRHTQGRLTSSPDTGTYLLPSTRSYFPQIHREIEPRLSRSGVEIGALIELGMAAFRRIGPKFDYPRTPRSAGARHVIEVTPSSAIASCGAAFRVARRKVVVGVFDHMQRPSEMRAGFLGCRKRRRVVVAIPDQGGRNWYACEVAGRNCRNVRGKALIRLEGPPFIR
jgi:hypothetical protein